MLRPLFFALFGLTVAVGCGSSSVDSFDDGEGGESSGGSSVGGSSGTGTGGGTSGTGGAPSGGSSGSSENGGTTTGGADTGGTDTGGTDTGGNGGAAGLGGSAGTTGGAGTAGIGGSAGTTTNPDCPVREPAGGSMCSPDGLRCPYDTTGCRCLSVLSDRCYQVDTSCFTMSGGDGADRIAPPPVHWCACTSPTDEPLGWDCAQLPQ